MLNKKRKLDLKALSLVLASLISFVFFGTGVQADEITSSDPTPKLEKKLNAEWAIEAEARSIEEDVNKTVGSKSRFKVKGTYDLSPSLYLKGEAHLRWFSDNNQLENSDDYSTSPLSVKQLTVNFKPASYFVFSAGSISQKFLRSGLFISSRAFPGLKQQLRYQSTHFEMGFIGQQAIPTSTSFNSDRTEQEEIPEFYTNTLYVKGSLFAKPSRKWLLEYHLGLSSFKYRNLPAVVADQGSSLGHVIIGNGATAKFRSEFEGYLLTPSLCICFVDGTGISFKGQWADNLETEENDRLEGMGVSISHMVSDLKFAVRYGTFFKDSEVAPAVYGGKIFTGGNNRKGQSVGLSIEFPKYNFRINADYYDVDVISANPLQNERTTFAVGLETLYVTF